MTKLLGRFISVFLLGLLLAVSLLYLVLKQPRDKPLEVENLLLKERKVDLHQIEQLGAPGPHLPFRRQDEARRGKHINIDESKVRTFNTSEGYKPKESKEKAAVNKLGSTGGVIEMGDAKLSDVHGRLVLQQKQNGVEGQVPPKTQSPNTVPSRTSDSAVSRGLSCDSECTRFKVLMDKWPPNKPKAAIYFLTHSGRLRYLKSILSQLDQYFNINYHYPIIIFHERDLRPHLSEVRGYTTADIYFQEIQFKIPSFLTKPVETNIPCISHLTYRHMCRFHAKGLYEEPIMQDLELSWRLDDDSELLRPIKYDVFKFMKSHNYMYGYVIKHWDAMSCTTGLWNSTEVYIKENNLKPTFFSKWKQPRLYYNNFEISSMKLWLSQEYKKFINFLDQLGGIYYHRWGDAPIKGIAVSLFVPENQINHFKDVAYRHRSMQNDPKDKQ